MATPKKDYEKELVSKATTPPWHGESRLHVLFTIERHEVVGNVYGDDDADGAHPLHVALDIVATALTEIRTGETMNLGFTYGEHTFRVSAEPIDR